MTSFGEQGGQLTQHVFDRVRCLEAGGDLAEVSCVDRLGPSGEYRGEVVS